MVLLFLFLLADHHTLLLLILKTELSANGSGDFPLSAAFVIDGTRRAGDDCDAAPLFRSL